ncbi:MAG: ABC transporter permease, partial [Prevotella sp.]|nr:ABC transporter permease [Prevotella sp.]
MNFPLFIAQRIYSDRSGQRQVSRPAITIATIGVAIGLAVMIVSVGVVLGFKHSIRDKVIGFGSHITVGNFMTLQSSEQYPIQMGDSMMRVLKAIDGVKHVQRYAMKQGILKTDSDFLGIMLKGIGPEYDTTFISHNLKEGCLPHFSDTAASQKVVISKLIADKLRLKNGQRVYAYFIGEQGVRTRRFTIAGIYESNLKHFDETMCFTDIYTTNKLNGWEPDQYSGAELTASNFDQLDQVATNVRKKVNHTLDTYGETYSSQDIIKMNP